MCRPIINHEVYDVLNPHSKQMKRIKHAKMGSLLTAGASINIIYVPCAKDREFMYTVTKVAVYMDFLYTGTMVTFPNGCYMAFGLQRLTNQSAV